MHALCQQGMFWKAGHTSLHTLPLMLLLFTISRSSGVKPTLTRVDVTWMSLELPMRDHELEVSCEFGNKLSAQGNNTCSMEFAKLRRRCIVALCLVTVAGYAQHSTLGLNQILAWKNMGKTAISYLMPSHAISCRLNTYRAQAFPTCMTGRQSASSIHARCSPSTYPSCRQTRSESVRQQPASAVFLSCR